MLEKHYINQGDAESKSLWRLCVTHSTCLTSSHATACTAVSSTNSFPALSLPDPLSAEHGAPQPITTKHIH